MGELKNEESFLGQLNGNIKLIYESFFNIIHPLNKENTGRNEINVRHKA